MSVRTPVLTILSLTVVALAAALGVVLGSGTGDGATTAGPSVVAASEPTPVGFTGRWSGPLRERRGPTVDLRLAVTEARTATLDIPALGCRYTGTVPDGEATATRSAAELPRGTSGTVVRLRESADPQRLCASRAIVRLTPLAARSLRYELLSTCDAGGRCVRKDAVALLTAS